MTEAVHHFEHGAGEYAKSADNRPEFDERFKLFTAAIDAISPAGGAGLTAVDLGCGPGHLTCHLASRGFRTIAIDGSETMLARTRRRLEQKGIASVDLRRHTLPLPADTVNELAGQVDLIAMSSVIEYIDQDSAVLAQCARLLRSGGEALVSFPNRRSLYWRVQRPLRRTPIFAHSASRHQRHQYDPGRSRRWRRRPVCVYARSSILPCPSSASPRESCRGEARGWRRCSSLISSEP